MVKLNVPYNDEDREVLMLFYYKVGKCHFEMDFGYNDIDYHINVEDDRFVAYENAEGTPEYSFDSIDDLLEHFMLDGKPLKDLIPELDYVQA